MTVHELKTTPFFFRQIFDGEKTFEIRKNDRNYQKGDILLLQEWDPKTEKYTEFWHPFNECLVRNKITVLVTSILHGGIYGLRGDFVIMSIRCYHGKP